MSAREDTVDVEAIRDLHTPPVFDVDDRESYCICGHPYPCDAARLLDALARSEAARQEAERERRYLDATRESNRDLKAAVEYHYAARQEAETALREMLTHLHGGFHHEGGVKRFGSGHIDECKVCKNARTVLGLDHQQSSPSHLEGERE